MAFLDETGLAELWALIKAEDLKAAKSELVSYVGTGEYGSSNPCILTFNFAPKVVIYMGSKQNNEYGYYSSVLPNTDTPGWIVLPGQMPTTYTEHYGFCRGPYSTGNYPYGKRSEDGKTIYWYHPRGQSAQINTSNYRYFFLAIG